MKVVVVGICNEINFAEVWITPTYRYFLMSKDICVFLAYLQFGQCLDILNISPVDANRRYLQSF
jgi:hypothetical protein